MTTRILRGRLTAGLRDAKNWGIDAIRTATGCDGLKPGTLNVTLDAPHKLRVDATLFQKDRTDGRTEELFFERCELALGDGFVPAWIARTSRNFHGERVLEIMAGEMLRDRYGLKDNDAIEIRVFQD